MGWKFLDDSKSANKKYREDMMLLINSWWAHFQNKRKAIESFLDGRAQLDIEDFMTDYLQSIDENFMWEYGTEPDGRYQLVITPETERHLRPLVETIIESAPKLSNWSFYAYRQPHGLVDTAELVKDHTGVLLDAIKFAADADEDNLINIIYKYEGAKGAEALGDAVFMATEYLLGEEILDRWVGDMDFSDEATKGASLKPISELPNTIASLIEKIKKSMPDKPLATMRGSLKPQEITVEPEDELDETERFDMVAASTLVPKVWQAAHSGSAFDSCRFSKHNEKFCYLKLEGITTAAKLTELEGKINEVLAKESLGCTIGSARGQRNGYIDLCLTDPAKAIAALKSVPQTECRLKFFDADWANESISL
jgi:hypothetical protein